MQPNLFGDGLRLPDVRTRAGAITVLTLVLYPYVYTPGRSALMGQSLQAVEAARTLGLRYRRPIRRVAMPLAPCAGARAAVMEALADFGTVNLLGYQALTDAIYRVWYGAFDQAAALQLATVLVGLALTLMAVERCCAVAPGTTQALGRGDAVIPAAARARAARPRPPPSACLLVVIGLPTL